MIKNIYVDYDGVIRDTMTLPYEIMKEKNIDLNDYELVSKFFSLLDWDNLISLSRELNNAYYYLNEMEKEGKYKVAILTKVNSLNEMKAKLLDIKKNSNIKTICVPSSIDKTDVVCPNDSVLIDDYSGNLVSWEEKGGIGIKYCDYEHDSFICTDSLDIFTNNNLERKLALKK